MNASFDCFLTSFERFETLHPSERFESRDEMTEQ